MNLWKRIFGPKEDSQTVLRTSEVFRVSGVPEHTYVERKSLNKKIDDFFLSKDSVLLFLGYSKSGKTVYRKKHLERNNSKIITFRCNNESAINQLYDQIASEANLGQIITEVKSQGGSDTYTASGTMGMNEVASVTGEASSEVNYSYAYTEEKSKVKVDVNFICNKLKGQSALIILEDYHLVSTRFNKTLSEDLKHFLDDEILFVLLGIPSSPNRALRNNPDLAGRLQHLLFDYLTIDEIKELISLGTQKLNVWLSEDVINEITKASMKNAFLVQYICKYLLIENGIEETQSKEKRISDKSEVHKACLKISTKLDQDYQDIYNIINAGIRKQQENKAFNQYEEILKVLKAKDIEVLEKGIHYTDIFKWSWDNYDSEKVSEFINNGTYTDETSFKNSFRTQIKQAVEKVNQNLERSTSRPVLYVDDGKTFLTDLIFKFYLTWKKDGA